VIKEKVKVEIVSADAHPLLPGNKAKAASQLKQKTLHFPQDRCL
jgi:hypothetical protein